MPFSFEVIYSVVLGTGGSNCKYYIQVDEGINPPTSTKIAGILCIVHARQLFDPSLLQKNVIRACKVN
jgi:hypothetical protein